jgi:phage terminase small subunit
MSQSKRSAFVEEYLRDWNATQAALRAGYSPRSAYSQGGRLLKNAEVQSAISQRLKEKKMTADEDLVRLSEQARVDISEFIQPGGAINWEAVQKKGYLVKKIKHHVGMSSEIELVDSQRALELIGKAHGLFVEHFEVDNKLTVVGLKALLDLAYGNNNTGS